MKNKNILKKSLILTRDFALGLGKKYLGPEVFRPLERTIGNTNLIFSSLDNSTLEPLAGYQPIVIEDCPFVFYPEGFRVVFQVFHNDKGDAVISFHKMKLVVENFWEDTDLELFYRREGKRIIGAGAKVHDYEVEFSKTQVFPAERVIGPNQYQQAKSENFFSIEPYDPIELSKGGVANISVLGCAKSKGIYNLKFHFNYNVAGKQNSYISESVFVVKH